MKKCSAGFTQQEGKCVATCKSDEYIEGETCKPCSEGCAQCLDSKFCLACKEGQLCGLLCPPGFKYDYSSYKCVGDCESKMLRMVGVERPVCQK